MSVEGSLEWNLLIVDTSTNTLVRDTTEIDIVGKVNNHIAVNFLIINCICQSLQLAAVTDDACTTYRADVVYILVFIALSLTLGVRVADVVAHRAIATH